jgi:hypothetical protein
LSRLYEAAPKRRTYPAELALLVVSWFCCSLSVRVPAVKAAGAVTSVKTFLFRGFFRNRPRSAGWLSELIPVLRFLFDIPG